MENIHMYQATIYQYNQRSEILIPERRGTTYYGPDNHKPLVVYRGLNIDIDFFVKDTDNKRQAIHNKTYVATVVDRANGAQVLQKNMNPIDYDTGKLVLHLDHEETFLLDAKLHDLIVTYNVTDQAGNYGGTSDRNMRLTFVVDVRDQSLLNITDSSTVATFNIDGDDRVGSRMAGPAQNSNKQGLQTAVVHMTNYTGVYKFQATLSIQPTEVDYFDVPSQSYTVSAKTGLVYHNFYGNYQFVRLVHTPDSSNTGTLDKVVYRS